jgi:hypothetical protein
MRIGFLIDRWRPDRGGAERAMADLASWLADRGHDVRAFAIEGDGPGTLDLARAVVALDLPLAGSVHQVHRPLPQMDTLEDRVTRRPRRFRDQHPLTADESVEEGGLACVHLAREHHTRGTQGEAGSSSPLDQGTHALCARGERQPPQGLELAPQGPLPLIQEETRRGLAGSVRKIAPSALLEAERLFVLPLPGEPEELEQFGHQRRTAVDVQFHLALRTHDQQGLVQFLAS